VDAPSTERRRATRIAANVPTVVEGIGQPSLSVHHNVASVYERVEANREWVGLRYPGILLDLSANGAFIGGEAPPLLSRVAFAFDLEGFGRIEALAWTLWRRRADCEITGADGRTVTLSKGIGVLFESISIDARIAIDKLVRSFEAR
jgi:hypothetical protein